MFIKFDHFLSYRTEKNASVWSKDVLKDLLTCVKFEDPDGSGSLTEVTSITGDASAKFVFACMQS